MNRKNVENAIKVMKKAKNLNMEDWQIDDTGDDKVCDSIAELHTCGNSACFAGYIGISKRFKKLGGLINSAGMPEYKGKGDSDAIAKYLEISESLAHSFVFGDCGMGYSSFYNKYWDEVQPEDVIKKLEMVLSGELV